MNNLIEDYFRCLDSIGWEGEVYIKKGGAFDTMVDRLGYVVKDDTGFDMNRYRFVYLP